MHDGPEKGPLLAFDGPGKGLASCDGPVKGIVLWCDGLEKGVPSVM